MKRLKKNKNKILIGVGIAILFVIGYALLRNYYTNYNYLKMNSSQFLVYTSSQTESGSYYQYKPTFNLKGELGTVLNQDIDHYLSNFTDEEIGITYEADLNGKVLSMIIKVEDHGYADSATVLSFRSYHVHLENREILSNETILRYFDLTTADAERIINQKIKAYYQELVNEDTINPNTCDYQCFLKSRDFTEDMEDVEYFIRDGKLIAFKPYIDMVSVDAAERSIHDFEIA